MKPATARSACPPFPALRVRNLVIGHSGKSLSAAINCDFEAGDVVAVVGRNGAGKSTLLRTLCGLQKPLAGEVLWEGKPLASMGRKAIARQVSVTLTVRTMSPMLTVDDVVATARIPYTTLSGQLTDDDQKQISAAISLCGLEQMRRRRLSTLSDGERQRVMIAKAFAQDTPAILLDEPTAFLDYVAVDEILGLLRQLAHERGKLILLTSHQLASVHQYADSMLELSAMGLQETDALFASMV